MNGALAQNVGRLRASARALADYMDTLLEEIPDRGLHHVYRRETRRVREILNSPKPIPARHHLPK